MARLGPHDLRVLAESVGLKQPNVDIAAAIAMAESGGDTAARGDSGKSIGLWQIHTGFHPQYDIGSLLTPQGNAKAMMAISGGGTNWSPWSVYKNGAYKKYLKAGYGLIGGEGFGSALGGAVSPEALKGDVDAMAGMGQDVTGAALGSIGGLASILTNGEWWKRIGVGLGGIALVVIGGAWVLKDVAAPALAKVPGPVGAVAKVAA